MSTYSESGPAADAGFPGRYSDGRSAQSHPVSVHPAAPHLEISSPDGAIALKWPYRSLAAATPVRKNAKDVTIFPQRRSAETLHVAAPGFAAALLARAPHLGVLRERWRYLKYALVAGSLLLLTVGGIWLSGISLAGTAARLLPASLWQKVGQEAVTQLVGNRPFCREERGRAALDRLMAKLSAASGQDMVFDVHVADWDLVNAFALPGQKIILTRKLIESSDSADQLAGVIAHEIGHGVEMDPETNMVRAIGLQALAETFFTGTTRAFGNFGTYLLLLRYSREAERRADAHALEILRRAQISPHPFARFFQHLAILAGEESGRGKAASPYGSFGEILSSHPASAERSRIAASQPRYPAKPALSGADWQALKAICKG